MLKYDYVRRELRSKPCGAVVILGCIWPTVDMSSWERKIRNK